jgi:hypothetical protein
MEDALLDGIDEAPRFVEGTSRLPFTMVEGTHKLNAQGSRQAAA